MRHETTEPFRYCVHILFLEQLIFFELSIYYPETIADYV